MEESPPEYSPGLLTSLLLEMMLLALWRFSIIWQIPLQRLAISEGSFLPLKEHYLQSCKGCFKGTHQRKIELTQALNTLLQFPSFGKGDLLERYLLCWRCTVRFRDKGIPALTQLLHYINTISSETHLVVFIWEPTAIVLNIAIVWDGGSYNCRKTCKKYTVLPHTD